MYKFVIAIVLTLAILSSGCTRPGLNLKKATVDASVGLSAVAALEAVPEAKFEDVRFKMLAISSDLLAFTQSGALADLPLDEIESKLEAYMIKKGWGQYTYMLVSIIQFTKTQSIPLAHGDTLNLIQIALEETIRNVERCTLEGRTKFKQ